MKKKTKIILFLLLLSPILGEVITGSTPPLEFINPIGFIILILLYGCGTLLIREAKVRWNLQWSIIFLAMAYGILEEGIMIQSFFNTAHADLGILSGYGTFFGIQWPWTILLTFFHGTISTLIPIAIAELLWPEYKNKPFLKKRGLILSFTGLISVVAIWMIFMIGQKLDPAYTDYNPNNLLIISSILIMFLLVWLAYKYRNSKILTNKFGIFPPFTFGIVGFLFQAVNLFLPNIFAEAQIPGIITIISQFILIILVSLFIIYQIYNQDITRRHIVSLLFGSVLFWIVLTPINEFLNGVFGIIIVGIIGLIMLIIWRHIALKN